MGRRRAKKKGVGQMVEEEKGYNAAELVETFPLGFGAVLCFMCI